MKIPKVEIFTQNKYKQYQVKDISMSSIDKIVEYNAFGFTNSNNKKICHLSPLISFFNHNSNYNVEKYSHGSKK